MSTEAPSAALRPVVVTTTKSVGIQILLVVFFGPLGLFYSTIKGALILLFAMPVGFAVLAVLTSLGASTAGSPAVTFLALGSEVVVMLLAWWIGSFVWGVVAVNSYNRKLLRGGVR